MILLVRGLVTPWLVGLHLLKPGGNPVIFVTNALEMKGQDTLGVGQREARAGSALSLSGHLLHALEIVQAPLQIGQALVEDHLSLRQVEKLEERHARKKLGLIGGKIRRKITQQGVQQRDAALSQVIEMAIGFAFLGDDLPGHGTHLFKAFEREVERLVVERDRPAKRPLDILFDLVAMPWALAQHGENDNFAIHMLPSSMILLLMRVYHRELGMSRGLRRSVGTLRLISLETVSALGAVCAVTR